MKLKKIEMKMKNFRLLTILLICLNSANIYSQCNIKTLKAKVLERIEKDLVDQDSSILLFNLTAGVDIKKYRGDKYCDTLYFTFQDGAFLRYYLIGSDILPGEAGLKLLRLSQVQKTPPVLINEIKSADSPSEIRYFDLHTKAIDEYYLVLQLDKKSSGCAFSTSTQYFPKTIK